MRPIDAILAELHQESAATLRVLEAVPEARLTWRPHPKSMSLGQLALHVATIPAQIPKLAEQDLVALPDFTPPEAGSRKELLEAHAGSLAVAQATLSGWSDDTMNGTWSFRLGDRTLMSLPRLAMMRGLMLNHLYHHRGQLAVYLRLLDVPVPSVYGPTADVNPFG